MTTLRILYLSSIVPQNGKVHAQGSLETQEQLLDIVEAALLNVSNAFKMLNSSDLTNVLYAETILSKITAVHYSKARFKSIQGRIKRYKAMRQALKQQVFSQQDPFAQRLAHLQSQVAALHNTHKVALFALKFPTLSLTEMLEGARPGTVTPAFTLAFDEHFTLRRVPTKTQPEPFIYALKA